MTGVGLTRFSMVGRIENVVIYLVTNTAATTLLPGLPQRSHYIVKIAFSVNIRANNRTANSLQDERN